MGVEVNRKVKRQEMNVPVDCFLILSVGELNKNKNHETIIKAIAALNDSGIHYAICGKGELRGYLQKLVKKLGIEKNIHILGFRNDVEEVCKAADVFVFPSKREGLGIAALEAMACELPIITSNVHGIVDYSLNGKTGYTCNPTNVKGFAKAIKILYQNKVLREKFGKYNSRVVDRFDIIISMIEMRRIYEERLSNQKRIN